MKIRENTNYFNGKDYSIYINQEDNLEPEEIAECFKEQYPKEGCAISFSRIIQIEIGLIIIGLKLPNRTIAVGEDMKCGGL